MAEESVGILSQENMAAKTDDPGDHLTSPTFGLVYSDHETDKAGNGPKDFAAKAKARKGRAHQAEPKSEAKSEHKQATATPAKRASS